MAGRLHLAARTAAATALSAALATPAAVAGGDTQWFSAWTAPPVERLTTPAMGGTSVRMVVRPTVSGDAVRVTLENALGRGAVVFASAYIGRILDGAALVPGSNSRLTFGGHPGLTLAAGAGATSDPLPFPVEAVGRYAVSLDVTSASDISAHSLGLVTNYMTAGAHASDETGAGFAPVPNNDRGTSEGPTFPFYWVTALDVRSGATTGTIVALGDSITDGECSTRTDGGGGSGVVTPDLYNRWTDVLAGRLAELPSNRSKAVADEGIAGNRVASGGTGPPALARIGDDVLGRSGATHVVFLEGTNDIANGATAAAVTAADQQIIDQAHAAGMRVVGATIIPRGGSNGWTNAMEQQRVSLNDWLRHQANFDALVDFDELMQGPVNPANNSVAIRPEWSCYDGVHPNAAGYQAMGEFIDPIVFEEPGAGAPELALTWVPGSSVKLEQLIGDIDYQTKAPTLSLTKSRYSVAGTDLGYSFQHGDELVFLFGDTLGFGAGDTMAHSAIGDPEAGLVLDFFTKSDGSTLLVQPPGVAMGPFEVPDSGISVADKTYVVCKTNHSTDPNNPTDTSVLTRFDETTGQFTVVRQVSQLPGGKFVEIALREVPAGYAAAQPSILMWGSGVYRASDVYLATVPTSAFETGTGTQYFTGLTDGQPTWGTTEASAVPVVLDGTVGNVSVTYAPSVGLWLMTYDSRASSTKGIVLRYAQAPWGPWSPPQVIFDPKRDGAYGIFIHDPSLVPDDGLDGPTIGSADPHTTAGGDYAPYVIERFTKLEGGLLSIYYTMSTWNPYTVVLMRSRLRVTLDRPPRQHVRALAH
ncbi:MAG TPA: DUF4185 domain-containing protein [Thermoanaerobaculaceae bacterium]|nr:DUF4185 domain-containing protein [Thermoanaerobaculaceae bacterium]